MFTLLQETKPMCFILLEVRLTTIALRPLWRSQSYNYYFYYHYHYFQHWYYHQKRVFGVGLEESEKTLLVWRPKLQATNPWKEENPRQTEAWSCRRPCPYSTQPTHSKKKNRTTRNTKRSSRFRPTRKYWICTGNPTITSNWTHAGTLISFHVNWYWDMHAQRSCGSEKFGSQETRAGTYGKVIMHTQRMHLVTRDLKIA